jgi:tetratricopeptide (TPR) repeat protein
MGSAAYLFRLGQVYQYGGKPDSAILFYKEAEPQYVHEFDQTPRYNIYASLADCYYKTNNNKEAIVYYEKAYQVALDQDMIAKRLPVTLALSKLFGDLKDYQKANYYLSGYIALKDSLNIKANQKDIALAEINNEKEILKERQTNCKAKIESTQSAIHDYNDCYHHFLLFVTIAGYVSHFAIYHSIVWLFCFYLHF